MKLGFVTCVRLGLSCMEAIYSEGGRLSLALTLKDSMAKEKAGRVYIDDFCEKHKIPLYKINHINDLEVLELIVKHDLDWLFIIGWSQIASKALLNAPKKGVLGMHPTLLPIGRGRAAIPWAIIHKLDKTGVTLFKLDEGVDTGPILSQVEIPLSGHITATELYDKVDAAHVDLIKKVIPDILSDAVTLRAQDEKKASVWKGRTPEDGKINLKGSIYEAENLIRAVTKPYPGAFVYFGGKKYIIWKAKIIDSVSDNGLFIEFIDGILECLEWEIC